MIFEQVNPVVMLALAGLTAVASLIAQATVDSGWAEVGALGLMGASFLLLLTGVAKGDIIHIKSKEREEALEELVRSAHRLAETAHAREVVHEKFMTAAVDRIVKATRDS